MYICLCECSMHVCACVCVCECVCIYMLCIYACLFACAYVPDEIRGWLWVSQVHSSHYSLGKGSLAESGARPGTGNPQGPITLSLQRLGSLLYDYVQFSPWLLNHLPSYLLRLNVWSKHKLNAWFGDYTIKYLCWDITPHPGNMHNHYVSTRCNI